MDEGHKLTDKLLAEIVTRLREIYGEALAGLEETINHYFDSFAKRDAEMQTLLKSGEITEEKYKQWRLAQMGRGKRFKLMRDQVAERLTKANETAYAFINDRTPGVYTLNRNYGAYNIERYGVKANFVLYNEATVRYLIAQNPDLMPYYPKKLALKRGIDLEYGKKRITASVTSGILMGRSTRDIAADLRKYLKKMEIENALRAARTAVTAAENGGRAASDKLAVEMGIPLVYEWSAAHDARTRWAHGRADGQTIEPGKLFIVGGEKLEFPGDTSHGASGWNIYNCRCRRLSWVKGHAPTREKYSEWLKRREKEETEAAAKDDVAALDFLGADARDDLQKIITRSTMKLENGFAAFPAEDPLRDFIKKVKPLKTFFDVAMHGSPTAVGFGTAETNMSPRLLASVIRHSEGWNGQKIRLLSCSTGAVNGDDYCFAEELANTLGVVVKAPNDTLYITQNGRMYVGKDRNGKFVDYYPNQRGRRK